MEQVLDFSLKKRVPESLTPPRDLSGQPSPSSTTTTPTSPLFQAAAVDLFRRAMIEQSVGLGCSPGLLTSPDPALLPTTSLALSALHRRRRRTNPVPAVADADSSSPSPKKLKSVVHSEKDDLYWERRRKNNDAAKRSRDNRKAKEEEIAVRAALLEQENLKLKAQVNVLKNEMARIHCLLFNQT